MCTEATFIVVDVSTWHYLLGRDQMSLLGLDVSGLVFKGFQKASQVYCTGMIPQILSKQVDILIPKNQVLQIYLKHHDNVYKTP